VREYSRKKLSVYNDLTYINILSVCLQSEKLVSTFIVSRQQQQQPQQQQQHVQKREKKLGK
jgi:hypothetical protein